MKIARTMSFAAAAVMLALGTAQAASDKSSGEVPNFNEMDKNNDGALTRNEAAGNPKLLAHFKQVDDDGDGKLSRGEYLAIMARQDLYNVRENIAEFLDPEGKPPLARGQQAAAGSTGQQQSSAQKQGAQVPAMAASDQLIRNVQEQLQAKGVDAGPVDGIWGPQTYQGVREFQQAKGLDATGQLNPRTLAALGIGDQQTASAGQSASPGGPAGKGSAETLFDRLDRNNDGSVSRSEFDAMK